MAGKAIVRPVFRSTDDRLTPGVWDPRLLFVKGEQGALYDPGDLSTLFQDAAGTVPVTADGDPVGLMLDKSPNGNHATQSVAASRPVYQRGDSRGVVNLLKWSEDFDNAVWEKFQSGTATTSVAENAAIAPNGTLTADKITFTAGGSNLVTQSVTVDANGAASISVYLKGELGGEKVRLDLRDTTSAGVGGPLITLTTSWVRYDVSLTNNGATNRGVQFRRNSNDGGGGSFFVWGAQLEQGTTATAYQRNDSHLGGVATGSADDLHWLADDKVDDVMTATLPAMPTATVATATDDGVVINYPVNIPAGAYSVDTTSTQGFDYGRVIVDRQLTAPEQTTLTTYLEDKS